MDALVLQRAQAKKAKNFAEADRIRDELKAMVSRSSTPRKALPGGGCEPNKNGISPGPGGQIVHRPFLFIPLHFL